MRVMAGRGQIRPRPAFLMRPSAVSDSTILSSTPIIEVKLEITNKPVPVTPDNPGTPYTPSNAPKTGDDTPVFLFVALMAGAAGVLAVLWCRKRKRA